MKKTLLRLVVLVLTVAMVFSCTACGSKEVESDLNSVVEFVEYYDESSDTADSTDSTSSTDSKDSSKTSSKTSSKNSSKTSSSSKGTTDNGRGGSYDVNINTQNVAGDSSAQLALQKELKDSGKGKTLTFLSTYYEDGLMNQCYSQMFKALCGGTLKVIRVDWDSMQQKLASMHASGESPDLYEVTNQDYPSIAYNGLVVDLSKHIDFSSELYSDSDRDQLSQLSWNGGVYMWPVMKDATGSRQCIWWNRSLFEQAGVSDAEMPDALVKANNWTWDTFYALQKRLTNLDKGIYGYVFDGNVSFSYQIVASTGEDFIKSGSDGLMSNFTSSNVTRAMNMYKKMMDPNYTFVGESGSNNGTEMFEDGKGAMMLHSLSAISRSKLNAMANDGVAEIAPFPRDPKSKTYNFFGPISGLAVPVGSKNQALAINFIKMLRASDYYNEQVADIYYSQNGFTDEAIAYAEKYVKEYRIIPCISLGVKEILGITWKSTGNDFITGADTWENRSAEYSPQIQSILDKIG